MRNKSSCFAMMKKVKSYELRVISFLIIFLSFLILHSAFLTPTLAQTPQTATSSAKVNPILEKINAIKQQAASKAAELKQIVSSKLQNKVFSGKIMNIDGSKLTLQGRVSEKIVLTNEYTAFENEANPRLKFDVTDLSSSDNIAALGDADDKNQLTAKKLVKLKSKPALPKDVVWGEVQKANANQIQILSKGGKTLTVISSGETQIMLGNDEATLKDISENKVILASGKLNGEKLSAEYIYIGSRGGTLKPIKVTATPSASVKN